MNIQTQNSKKCASSFIRPNHNKLCHIPNNIFAFPFPGCLQKDEADIFFFIDHSGSIYPKDFEDMKKFMIEFINTFRIGPQHVRIGVVKYADNPDLEFDLTAHSDVKSLENAVEAIRQLGGGTETGRALTSMVPHYDRALDTRDHKVPKYLVVITDGKSADEVKVPAEQVRAQGVTVYAIGVKSADPVELQEIAGDPKRTFFVNNFDALTPIKDDIITDICSPEGKKLDEGLKRHFSFFGHVFSYTVNC